MSKPQALGFLLLGCIAMLAPTCPKQVRPPRPDARAFSTAPGSCDGITEYGDEFEITYIGIGPMRSVGFGVYEVELDLEILNHGDATYRAASMTPVFSAAPELQVVTSPAPLAAEFGQIEAGGTASSTVALRLQIPATHFGDMIQRLRDGSIPLAVYADEVNELAPGVEIRDWTSTEDLMYEIAADPAGGYGFPPNPDPGPGPFAPGQEFDVFFVFPYTDDEPTVFEDYKDSDLLYLVENPESASGVNDNIPDAFDRVRVLDATRVDEEDDQFTAWSLRLKRTDTESLPAIYSTASFCTGPTAQIDYPVQKSRLTSLDGDAVAPEESDASPQGIRFNGLSFGGGAVTVSGQVQGHVLKPSLSFRIRNGRVSTQADFDTDLALTAELQVKSGSEVAIESLELWSLCFPLPEFVAGPVSVAMNLQLKHTLGAEASFTAGAVVGFAKHWDSGFTITCDSGGGAPSSCDSDGRREESPIQFTPPQLTDDTAAHGRVETTLGASLNFFSPYPICDAGPSLFTAVTAYGELDVTPTQDPWWEMDYGLDITAGIDLDILGFDIGRYDTDLFTRVDDGPGSGVGGPRSAGEDQRWAVAIDDTQVPNGVSASKIAALPDGSSVAIASEAIFGRTPLVKLDRFGAMQWVKEFVSGKVPVRVRPLSDGTFVVVGTNAWLARIDGDGNLLWSFDAELSSADYASGRCVLRDVAVLDHGLGHYDFVAVGRMGTPLVTSYDACALRVNEDGSMPWARIYQANGAQHFYGAVAMQDGNVMAVGTDSWSYLGTRAIPLFVKLDPTSGDPIWWKGMPMTRLAHLDAVTESADGTLFAVGSTSGIIYTTGTAIVARIAPDGSGGRHAEIYQDEDWEALLDFETWVDTEGGDTPYDGYYDIAPSGDGFVIAGATGLGDDRAGRVAKINANLGTEWITTFDGESVDVVTGVSPSGDGLFVSGFSASLPEADGGSGENQLWVMKLPFTGAIGFLPGIDVTTRFVVPAVRDSTNDLAVNPLGEPTIERGYSVDHPIFSVEEANAVSSGANPGLLVTASPYCVELLTETGHVTTTDACLD